MVLRDDLRAGSLALLAMFPPQVMTGDEDADESAAVDREAAAMIVWETFKYLRGYCTNGKAK